MNQKNIKQKIKCLICGSEYIIITQAHLKRFHNTTVKEYKERFPNCKLSLEPIGVQILQKKNPEKFKEHQSKAGKKLPLETHRKNMEKHKEWEARLTPEERYLLRRKKGLATSKKHPHLFKENLKKWRETHPEEHKKLQSEVGKKAILKLLEFLKEHPEVYSIAGKASHKKNPNLASERMIERIRKDPSLMKKLSDLAFKKYPELAKLGYESALKRYPNLHSIAGKSTQQKHPELSRITLEKTRKKYPDLSKKAGQKAVESLRKGKPYLWENVKFDSKEELEVAKLLLDKPMEGVNCQVKVGYFTVDFFPKQKVFIEYHPNLYNPSNLNETKKQYMAKRIKNIKASEHRGTRIKFIFDSFRHNKERVLEQIKKIKEDYSL